MRWLCIRKPADTTSEPLTGNGQTGAPVKALRVVKNPGFPNGAPAKADGLCGEEEMPSHWQNFLLAGNGAVWLVS